jgi:hypothetical protein
MPLQNVATLTEAFRRAVLKMFVKRELMDSQTTDALEFLAKLTSHIPNKGQVLQRYYGFYSSRQRAERRKASGDGLEQTLEIVQPEPEALRDAKRRCESSPS